MAAHWPLVDSESHVLTPDGGSTVSLDLGRILRLADLAPAEQRVSRAVRLIHGALADGETRRAQPAMHLLVLCPPLSARTTGAPALGMTNPPAPPAIFSMKVEVAEAYARACSRRGPAWDFKLEVER